MYGLRSDLCASADPSIVKVDFLAPDGPGFLESTGEAEMPKPASEVYVPFSERDPRRKLDGVVAGKKEGAGQDEGEETLFTKVSTWVVSVFVVIGVTLGIIRAVKRPEMSFETNVPEPKDSEFKNASYDASHLLDYDAGKRSRIIEAWKSLPYEMKISVLEEEVKGIKVEKSAELPLPPHLWSLRFAALLEKQGERRFDLTTSDGMFSESKALEGMGNDFMRLHLYENAVNSLLAAARAMEAAGASSYSDSANTARERLLQAVEIYRAASSVAEMAGNGIQKEQSLREAQRVWVKARVAESLRLDIAKSESPASGNNAEPIVLNQAEAISLAEAVSRRIVEDPSFASRMIKAQREKGNGTFNYPELKDDWREAVRDVAVEQGLGLRPGWRSSIERFYLLSEEPGMKQTEFPEWYVKMGRNVVAEFAPHVLNALKDEGFRSKFLKNGTVVEEGLQIVMEELMKREFTKPAAAGSDKPISEFNAGEKFGLDTGWKKGIEKFFLLNEEPDYKGFQGQGWYAEVTNEAVEDFAPLVLKALQDESFREKYLKEGVVTEEGLQAVYDAWRKGVGSTLVEKQKPVAKAIAPLQSEQALGLEPGWKKGIEKFFLLNEEPGYKEFQGQGWYAEVTNEAVEDFAPLVLKALEDKSFREKYLKEGVVTEDGLQAVLEAEQRRISVLKSKPTSEPKLADATKAKEADDIAKARRQLEEKILYRWHKEKGRLRILTDALRAGEKVVEIGTREETIPVKWIVERFSQKEVSSLVRRLEDNVPLKVLISEAMPKLMADKEMKSYLDSLSKPERKAFLDEQLRDWRSVGKGQDVVSWMKNRMSLIRQIDNAEFVRENDERKRDRENSRKRKDRSRQGLVEKAGKK